MRSLYTRIFAAFWVVMILILAGAVGLTWLVLAERSEAVPRLSAEVVPGAAVALREGGEQGLRSWLWQTRTRYPGFRVLVVTPKGQDLLGRPLPPSLLGGAPPGAPEVLHPGVIPARPLPQVVDGSGQRYGIAVVPSHHGFDVFEPLETRLGILLFALVATGLASGLLTRSITRPLRSLGAATRAIARGELDTTVDPALAARRDEFGTLGRDFGAMADRLRLLLEGREQLLRDVSHELRSPLARMRVAAGLARQDGADVPRQVERIEGEIERLDRLIGQVLYLSRLDARSGEPLDEEVELAELIDGIAHDAAFEAQARRVVVDWNAPAGPHLVRGNSALLASAIENVVRNAIAYTGEGTRVRIELAGDARGERIAVSDQGPGVPAGELQRIFEPFHRVAESRTRESGGDGIGLAITARVMRAHGGVATAENQAGGGLRVTLTLPSRTAGT